MHGYSPVVIVLYIHVREPCPACKINSIQLVITYRHLHVVCWIYS